MFHHDIIYEINRNDNEKQSGEVARERLRSFKLSETKIERVYNQILSTKTHSSENDNDTKILLDLDLAILGDTSEKYKEYYRDIRKEHSIYPDEEYTKGRIKVIQHFLSMKHIYKTDLFIKQYENQARDNLTSEWEILAIQK